MGENKTDIVWFKSKQLDADWVYVGEFKPTFNHWESWSISSPTVFVKGSWINLYYEGRYESNKNDFSIGLMEIDLAQEKSNVSR